MRAAVPRDRVHRHSTSRCPTAQLEQVQVERVTKLRLVVNLNQLDGRPHLPIFKLERAA